MTQSGRAAFFDLDRTLISVSSGHLWFRRERAEGRLSWYGAIEAAVWGTMYTAGLTRSGRGLQRAVRNLQGESETEMIARSREFYANEIAHCVSPGAHAVLQRHREAGEKIVLLTSSTNYLAELIGRDLQFDEVLAMRLEAQDDRFTGRIEQLCFGPAKVQVAEAWALQQGVDLEQCWFYSDSYTDLAMLERVGKPVAVHPDRRLLKTAQRRGWPIQDWTQPARA
ncbi:MAG: HAD-IB family hydrolase [Rickettsiales bacterium]|nr:HAD-IB family hydrolase [Rickettsiales bacterium]